MELAAAIVLVALLAWDFGRRKLAADRQVLSEATEKAISERIEAVEGRLSTIRRDVDTLKSREGLRETAAIGHITGVRGKRRG